MSVDNRRLGHKRSRTKSVTKRALRRGGLTRQRVASARMCVERNVIARFTPSAADPSKPRILCYHSIGTPEWGVNDVTPAQFSQHIEAAHALGRRFVAASSIAAGQGKPGDLALTFDDGLASINNALPLLKAYRIPATVFVVTDWADGCWPVAGAAMLTWREVESLASADVNIGSHSMTHPNFTAVPNEIAREELARSREIISSRVGILADEFAVPFGQSGDWSPTLTEMALRAGYKAIYAQSENRRTAGTAPRTFISRWDRPGVFKSALRGRFDSWEEWM